MPPTSTAHPSSISVIVPAHNEAPRLAGTVEQIAQAARQEFDEYEIIIVDDGSSDGTPALADQLADTHSFVRVLHLAGPNGVGAAFKAGLRTACKEYVTIVHGDGGTPASELMKIWSLRHQADLVVPYVLNEDQRPRFRLFLSRCFRSTINLIFATGVRYHTHFILYRREAINSVRLRTDGHALQVEAVVKLLRSGHSFAEVGVIDDFESQAPTRSYGLRNLWSVATFLVMTAYDVYVGPKPPAAAVKEARV